MASAEHLFVVRQEDTRRLLVVRRGEGWGLPRVEADAGWVPAVLEPLARLFHQHYGFEIDLVRHVSTGRMEVCEAEALDQPSHDSQAFRWVGLVDIAGIELSSVEHGVASAWFAEPDPPDPWRAAWERSGWRQRASDWFVAELAARGLSVCGRPEKIKAAWPASAVLRASTDDGGYFFKATFSKPPSEADVIAYLAAFVPDQVPRVVARHPDRRWMVTADFGSTSAELGGAPEALEGFSRLQLMTAETVGQLIELGCPELPPSALVEQVADAASEFEELLRATGKNPHMTLAPEELILPLDVLAGQLAETDLPLTIVHQDFRSGNIAAMADAPVFYDWSDVVVSHPFFSAVRFLEFVDRPAEVPKDYFGLDHPADEFRQSLRDAYLAPWADQYGHAAVQRDFSLAWKLRTAFQIARWHFERQFIERSSPWAQAVDRGLLQEWRQLALEVGN